MNLVAYNRFGQPVRSFATTEQAQRFIDNMAALGSTFTLKRVSLRQAAFGSERPQPCK